MSEPRVGGSNPSGGIVNFANVAQLARASACHAEGRGFEPLHLLSFETAAGPLGS